MKILKILIISFYFACTVFFLMNARYDFRFLDPKILQFNFSKFCGKR